jgi:hypothetical protein
MELSEILKLTPEQLDNLADCLERALSEIDCEVSSETDGYSGSTNTI